MLGWLKKKKKSGEKGEPDAAATSIQEKEDAADTAAENFSARDQDNKEAISQGVAPGGQALQPENQKGLFERLQERLTKTRDSLVSRVDDLFLGRKEIDAELLDELEEILITADLGVNTTLDLLGEIRNRVSRKELKDPEALKLALKERILTFFEGYAFSMFDIVEFQ